MKKALNKILYWGGFPFVVILTPIIGTLLDVSTSGQIVAIFPIFIMLKVFGKKDNSRWHLCLGVVTSTIAIILWKADVSTNPWSSLGWVIVIALTIFIWVGSSTNKKGSFGDTLDDPTTWTNLLGIIAFVTVLTGLYLFFLSQMIWLVITFAGITHLLFYENEEGISKEYLEDKGYLFTLFFIAIGVISTLIQFWKNVQNFFTFELFRTLPFWFVLLIALSIIGIFIAFKVRKKTMKAEKIRKQQAEQAQKSAEEAHLKKEKKREEVLAAFTKKVERNEEITWDDIVAMLSCGEKKKITDELIASTPFVPSLIKVSEIKQKLTFNNYEMSCALDEMNRVLDGSNDALIQKMLDQFKTITKYRDYHGYNQVWEKIRQRIGDGFILIKRHNNLEELS